MDAIVTVGNIALFLTTLVVKVSRMIPSKMCNLKLGYRVPVLNPISTYQSYSNNLKIEYLINFSKGQSKTISSIFTAPYNISHRYKDLLPFLNFRVGMLPNNRCVLANGQTVCRRNEKREQKTNLYVT